MHTVWIAMGSNLGDAKATFSVALKAMDPWIKNMQMSSCYRTSPVDTTGPDYVNAVVRGQTDLAPEALMRELLAIEKRCGRVRPDGVRYAPRTLDLDIVMWTGPAITSELVTIPHPRMHERLFVLVPLREVCPENRLMDGRHIDSVIEEILARDTTQMVQTMPNFMA